MESEKLPEKKDEFLLVSIKTKSDQSSSVYVVKKDTIGLFIQVHLNSDTIILVDSVETFVGFSD